MSTLLNAGPALKIGGGGSIGRARAPGREKPPPYILYIEHTHGRAIYDPDLDL
jgi:hypothetical protein